MRLLATIGALAALGCAAETATPSAPAPLVRVEQHGGFAGVDRWLTVGPAGRVAAEGLRPTTRKLAPVRLAALRDALRRARFATLARRYRPAVPIADGFVYRIRHAGRVVEVDQGARLPPRLARVFALLRKLAPGL